jgi:Ca2+-binding EF-hand superfamily protein
MPKLFALVRVRYLSLAAVTLTLLTGVAMATPAGKTEPRNTGASSDPAGGQRGHGAGRDGHRFDPFTRWDQDKDDKLPLKDVPERLKTRLSTADVDRDGILTRAEFDAGKERLRAERMKELDANKDGKVSAEERKALMRKHMTERFAAEDKNKDGALTADELPGRGFDHLAAADTNKDNRVTRAEIDTALANGTLGPRGHGHKGRHQPSATEREARMQAHFKSDDVNHDGFLTQTEIATRWDRFKIADADGDNKLTIDELKKAFVAGTLRPAPGDRRHSGRAHQNRPGHGPAR